MQGKPIRATKQEHLQHGVRGPVAVLHLHAGRRNRQALLRNQLRQGAGRVAARLAAGQLCGGGGREELVHDCKR